MTQRTTHTSTPQYFPPMADPMRPEAMTRPQLIDAWQDAASEVACMTALGYTADTDPDTREAWKYMRQIERELMKREIYTAQDMRADREAMEHRYRRMQ